MTKILLINGKSQHGKDQFASILEKKLTSGGKRVIIIHFADLLKFYVSKYFGYKGIKDETDRAILQYVGTTIVRAHYPKYWGRAVGEFLSACSRENAFNYAIIPDFRFKNEYEAIWDAMDDNALITTIRIERYIDNNKLYVNPNMTYEQVHHISECELDDVNVDWIIENRGSIEDLELSADIMLEHI